MDGNTATEEYSAKRGWIKLVLAGMASILLAMAMTVLVLVALARLPGDQLFKTGVAELGAGLLAVGVVFVLGGRTWLSIDHDSVGYAFGVGWMLLIVGIVASGSSVFSTLTSGAEIPTGALGRLFGCVILSLGIGLYEEALYRGIILGGLFAVMGRWRKGVMAAVLLAAIYFGWSHVTFEADADFLTNVQSILKIVQSAMFAIVMSDVMLHTRKLGGAVVFHAVNDFLFVGPSAILKGVAPSGEYTTGGSGAMMGVIVYGLMIAVFLYPTIRSLITIWREQDYCVGPFMEPASKAGATSREGDKVEARHMAGKHGV